MRFLETLSRPLTDSLRTAICRTIQSQNTMSMSSSRYGTALATKPTYVFMNSLRHHISRKGSILFQVPIRLFTSYQNIATCQLSRQNAIKEHTLEWIEIHFPGLFKQIHFGNHFALHGESRPKSEICRSFGAEILIDDNPRYAEECANIGMKVLLFDYENSYPWSKTESVDRHPLVTRVHNWEEVEQQILSLAVSKC
ncbi:hypothetical protein AtNW77_Chr4g0311991 [Arabidopsis thaliana]